jgi:hypothetical protein
MVAEVTIDTKESNLSKDASGEKFDTNQMTQT